jgi:magnesium transporter
MRDLIFAAPDQPLRAIRKPDVISVPASMDQEQVARVLRRHGYLALPVVDDHQTLLGVITADDLADVAEEEATEDIQKIGGTEALHAPYFDVGLASMLRKRGGWLWALFLGVLLTATAMGFFESTIQRAAVVAFGSVIGSMLPLILHRVGVDPASASAPFVATLVDVTGLVIYFLIAIAILSGTVL